MIVTYFRRLKPQLECCHHRISQTGRQLCTSANGIDVKGRPPVISKLKGLYCHKILPLERHYLFDKFHSPPLSEADFEANPMILMIGQYSTGKSSMIRYLIKQDYPGMRIGPEPTTDRFLILKYNKEEAVLPGHALAVDSGKQFFPLSRFGSTFLNRFQCSMCPAPILKGLTFIDTPGILSGEKQRTDRAYDFSGVIEWFSERVDIILLLFDAHKLDISDEFRSSIEVMKGNEDKIRIVLNKADQVDQQELMRVYGALMWSLGKVFHTPEVARVYIGSFWEEPLKYEINQRLFFNEENDLIQDLQNLTKSSALRKVNDLIKRIVTLKAHAHIVGSLRHEMPLFFGRNEKKQELIANLDKLFEKLHKDRDIPQGDFPEVERMREQFQNVDFADLPKMNNEHITALNDILRHDLTELVSEINTMDPFS